MKDACKTGRFRLFAAAFGAAFWFGTGVASAAPADAPLPFAKPEAVGMSPERLARIGTVLKADIAAGRIPGAVIAIARHGKLVAFDAYGWRDKAAGVPMTTDTIFNIASMTKPMATVGLLMLYEQGRVLMDEPLSKYLSQIRQFAGCVHGADGEPTLQTEPARRAIAIPRICCGIRSGLIMAAAVIPSFTKCIRAAAVTAT